MEHYDIELFELNHIVRLDAEYYQPIYIENIKQIKKNKYYKLKEISYITDGEHGSPIYDDNSGIRYYSAQHVKDGYIDSLNARNISKIIDKRNIRSRLSIDDILLSTVGTIGNAGLVTEKDLPANIDRHVAKIRINKELDPAYVVAFLNSKYGKLQTIRQSTGNVQLNLFIEKIKNIIVPVINDDNIIKKIRKSLYLLTKSINQYESAERLLINEINNMNDNEENYFFTNLYEAGINNRIDAEYYQPKYRNFISKIKDYEGGYDSLINYVYNITDLYNLKNTPNVYYNYIELSNVDSSLGIVSEKNIILGKEAPSRARRMVKNGDVIVSSVEGSLDKVAIINEKYDGSLASTGFFQFTPNEMSKELLFLMFKSKIINIQLKRFCAGTILTAISNRHVKEIIVPVLNNDLEKELTSLIKESQSDAYESKRMFYSAINELEDMI